MNLRIKQSGFSLVELMVGIVIALLGSLVITQVYTITEQGKQTTTSGSDAQQSGALAMLFIDKDLRQAGYGMNSTTCTTCPTGYFGGSVDIHDSGPRTVPVSPITFAPVLITQGVGNAPDTLAIMYGNASTSSIPTHLKTQVPGNEDIQVSSDYGMKQGDVMIIAQPDANKAEVFQLSGYDKSGQTDGTKIKHESGTFEVDFTTQSYRYNGSTFGNYDSKAFIYNLGPSPVNDIYTLVKDSSGRTNLVQTNLFNGFQQIVATDIVDFQAEYGKDTDADQTINVWDTATPNDPDPTIRHNQWKQIMAIRYALVSRSVKREPSCNVTTVAPVWRPDGVTQRSLDFVKNDPDWQCYRYRVYETTNALRNMMWNPED